MRGDDVIIRRRVGDEDRVIKRRREEPDRRSAHPSNQSSRESSRMVSREPRKLAPPPSLKDPFWELFYKKPARLPKPLVPFSYDAETESLTAVCKAFLDAPSQKTEDAAGRIDQGSNDFALESPLTPPSSILAAIEAGAVGETFKKARFAVCRCRKDSRLICQRNKPDQSGWYSGPCGDRVERSAPHSFIHVNLSRQVNSVEQFEALVRPVFEEKRVVYRLIPGDSGLTLALVAPDKDEEKLIRRLLREKQFREDKGIRIFQITSTLLGR